MPVAPQKRHDYINQDIVENQGGIPDVASEDWRRLATLVIMQERDDELHMRRNFFTEGPNKFEQMQCLADRCALCRAQRNHAIVRSGVPSEWSPRLSLWVSHETCTQVRPRARPGSRHVHEF